MTLHSFIAGIAMSLIGLTLMYAYVYYVRRKLGVRIGLIASIMYSANTDGMPALTRTVESFMRVPKYFGILMVVMGPIIMVTPT